MPLGSSGVFDPPVYFLISDVRRLVFLFFKGATWHYLKKHALLLALFLHGFPDLFCNAVYSLKNSEAGPETAKNHEKL